MTDKTYRFELYESPQGYRFRLKDAQGNTIGASRDYPRKKTALAAIDILKKQMPTAAVED